MPLNIFKEARTNVPSQANGGPRDRFYPCLQYFLTLRSKIVVKILFYIIIVSFIHSLGSTDSSKNAPSAEDLLNPEANDELSKDSNDKSDILKKREGGFLTAGISSALSRLFEHHHLPIPKELTASI